MKIASMYCDVMKYYHLMTECYCMLLGVQVTAGLRFFCIQVIYFTVKIKDSDSLFQQALAFFAGP